MLGHLIEILIEETSKCEAVRPKVATIGKVHITEGQLLAIFCRGFLGRSFIWPDLTRCPLPLMIDPHIPVTGRFLLVNFYAHLPILSHVIQYFFTQSTIGCNY